MVRRLLGRISLAFDGPCGADNRRCKKYSDRRLTLSAEGDVALLAAQNTASLSGSIGVSLGTSGVGVTASASAGRGKEAGDDLTHTNTHINAGNSVVLRSGGDTALQGALVKADKIQAEVGGNLLIESMQDTSTYASRQRSVGASGTIGAGAGGSLSAGSSRANSDFTSVAEQSGFKAGDGGFVVDVEENTALIGGAITSNQSAVENGLNSFATGGTITLSDINNTAKYSANSTSVGISSGGTSGSASFCTRSLSKKAAISGLAGNQAAPTGHAEIGIAWIFDKDKVKAEVLYPNPGRAWLD